MKSDDKLMHVLQSPKTSRRDFIRYAVAAGVTATVAGSMFDKARAATPQKGGSYIQALTGVLAEEIASSSCISRSCTV